MEYSPTVVIPVNGKSEKELRQKTDPNPARKLTFRNLNHHTRLQLAFFQAVIRSDFRSTDASNFEAIPLRVSPVLTL